MLQINIVKNNLRPTLINRYFTLPSKVSQYWGNTYFNIFIIYNLQPQNDTAQPV